MQHLGELADAVGIISLSHSNPNDTWDRDRDRSPVQYAGDYVDYNTETRRLAHYVRAMAWDEFGRLKSIGPEVTTPRLWYRCLTHGRYSIVEAFGVTTLDEALVKLETERVRCPKCGVECQPCRKRVSDEHV
jgi:hypothetical protein